MQVQLSTNSWLACTAALGAQTLDDVSELAHAAPDLSRVHGSGDEAARVGGRGDELAQALARLP
jgi:hypothetical protein